MALFPTLVLALALPLPGRAAADPARAHSSDEAAPLATAGVSRVVYLNFSEGTENLTFASADDATTNRSNIGQATPFPAFAWPAITTGVTTRPEVVRRVVRRVHELFLPYNVLVTTVRPAAGPYTMVMIGGGPRDIGLTDRLGGVAILDCEDRESANLAFAFPESLRGSEQALAVTIAQEAAHAFGLEHTNNRRDVMYPEIDPMQALFADEESLILGDRVCNNVTQNSHRKLLQTVGAWPGDTKPVDDGTRADRIPPRLSLLAPAAAGGDGGPEGVLPQPVVVSAEAEDEAGIDRLVLSAAPPGRSEGSERSIRRQPPWTWSLAGFPAGPLTLTLTAYDASGNTTVVARDVLLGAPPAAPPGCVFGASPAHSSAGGPAGAPWCWLLGATWWVRAARSRRAVRACARRAGPL